MPETDTMESVKILFSREPRFKVKSLSRSPGRDSIVIANDEKGIRVIANYYKIGNHSEIYLKVKTNGSGYTTIKGFPRSPVFEMDLANIYEKAVQLLDSENPQPKFDAISFGSERFDKINMSHKWSKNKVMMAIGMRSVIKTARVVRIVSIDGYVIVDSINIPDKECWYLMECTGHEGASFNIITNGDVFYPITRVTASVKKIKMALDSGKKTVDLTKTGDFDRSLILEAIHTWISDLTNQ